MRTGRSKWSCTSTAGAFVRRKASRIPTPATSSPPGEQRARRATSATSTWSTGSSRSVRSSRLDRRSNRGSPADAATLKKDPARAASKGAADLAVLFDAEGIEDTMDWATKQIAALGKALTADPKNAKAILAASPKFRGYFAKDGAYATRYTTQAKVLKAALAKLPSQWRDLTSSDVVVPDLFRIIQV